MDIGSHYVWCLFPWLLCWSELSSIFSYYFLSLMWKVQSHTLKWDFFFNFLFCCKGNFNKGHSLPWSWTVSVYSFLEIRSFSDIWKENLVSTACAICLGSPVALWFCLLIFEHVEWSMGTSIISHVRRLGSLCIISSLCSKGTDAIEPWHVRQMLDTRAGHAYSLYLPDLIMYCHFCRRCYV